MPETTFHLFEVHGVELEYMLVEAGSLSVLPATDVVLRRVAGADVSEVELGELCWSNELVLHVVELKTNGPADSLDPLPELFQRDVRKIDGLLAEAGGRLMPTAMHPWMDPAAETRLWPHEHSPVYEAYDRIFGCQGHGWANLQSVHLNLPFAGDEEFGRLHAAIRLLLPLLPALAASSPIVEGRATGLLDNRMEAYRVNSARIPSVAGEIVPEPVYTPEEYDREILQAMYRDIAPHDPEGILRHDFLNSRGAIPRFERDTFEIRVLDVQECPLADLAVVAATVAVLRLFVAERFAPWERQRARPVTPLAALLRRAIADGDAAAVDDPEDLALFGLPGARPATAGEVWRHLLSAAFGPELAGAGRWRRPLEVILDQGPLARRILSATGSRPSRQRLAAVYRRLCDCLRAGEIFLPAAEPG